MDNKRKPYEEEKRYEAEFLRKLGLKVKKYRREKDWSQEELGFHADLDRTYIGGIERGERNITILNLKKIADVLKVSVSDLLE